MTVADLASARVAVWGLGTEGVAAVRAFRARLPEKEVTVLEEAANPSIPLPLQEDAKIIWRNGKVTADILREFDVVVRSPGISLYRDDLVAARRAGVVFTSGTNLWFAENAGSRTICVTGSKGKSTTTHLIWHLLNHLGVRAVKAGNIGVALLELPQEPLGETVYVVELSSYQLSDFEGIPTVAVLLNLYPEHLDWHRGEENYYRDKTRLLAQVARARIVNRADPRSPDYAQELESLVWFNAAEGFHHSDTTVYRQAEPWITREDTQLLGEHNLSNLCAALTAVEQCGVHLEKDTVRAALRDFRGLDHRLSRLGERQGVLYINDSIATIPQATVAALRVFAGRPVTVLVGGHDRGLDQHGFAEMILREAPFAVVTLPGTGAVLAWELRALGMGQTAPEKMPQLHAAVSLEEAVAFAQRVTPAGGVVLLSPGAPSYNTHKNFVERGKAFARAVGLPIEPVD